MLCQKLFTLHACLLIALRCQRGDLKLSDSSVLTMTERMVEVCVDEVWKRVCAGSSWGQEEATVACRELGYSKGGNNSL